MTPRPRSMQEEDSVDHSIIDAVARAVAGGASRRQVLRLLAVGTVAGWLPGRAGAAPARQDCAASGLTDCGGVCVDISSDPFNCGGCGLACDSGVCEGGGCSAVNVDVGCVSPFVDCGGGCADLSSDPLNCGGCGIGCESGVCEGGSCLQVSLGCVSPLVECAGLCADLSSDPFNCGGCGVVCDSGVCEGGACSAVVASIGCVSPLVECGGLCADLTSDPDNCGACGNVCASGVCGGGVCNEVGCPEGFTFCEAFGACYDLDSDAAHCGACDITCLNDGAIAHKCTEGECVATSCAEPFVDCAGECIDFSADPNNCGACGTICESGVCESGVCSESKASPATPEATATTTAAPTPTTTPPTNGGSTRPSKPPRDRSQGGGSGSSSSGGGSGSAKPAKVKQAKVPQVAAAKGSESVLAWPFDPEAGAQWTIVNGYRGEGEHAAPTSDGQNYAVFAFDFAVCGAEAVNDADGTCELGPAPASGGDTSKPGWDTAATQGAGVLSPVDGTVVWTEEANALCPTVGIEIKGHPGYRLALFNVEGHPKLGESVKKGKKIGKVAKKGCEEGDRVHMALYQPQAGAADDPEAGRKGVPFTGDWTIARCDYPDDKKTANQYRGVLVPCKPEDEVSPKS